MVFVMESSFQKEDTTVKRVRQIYKSDRALSSNPSKLGSGQEKGTTAGHTRRN